MKALIFLVAGLIVVLCAVLLSPWKTAFTPSLGGVPAQDPAKLEGDHPPAKPVTQESRPKSQRTSSKNHSENGSIPAFPELPRQLPLLAESIKTPPPPFPEAGDLPSGMHRSRIKALYGEPIYVTTQTSNGRLYERYVYFNRERSLMTVGILENGRVVKASSVPN